ncbi:sorting nexin-16 [Brachyhypopomus gauderio]|uniref:sorting nexin-16 n=1 Tax=Brachyhypopomus gauderio TaxID=698409 RepID=UPI004041694A
MAASFVPFPFLRSTYGSARHGHRRASSLGNLSGSLDALPRNSWMRRGPCVPYQHQSTDALRMLTGEEDGADGADWQGAAPTPTLLGYEVMEERAKFTVYKILVQRAPDESWVIFRRYTDFCRLNDKLRESFPKFRLDLPPKRWFKDNYDMDFLEARRLGLQSFLRNLVTHKDIINSDVVRGFLCLDDPPGPFDSLEESRAYCETLEETNHRLQRELLDKQREIESLRRVLEDREIQISKLEQTKNGVAGDQSDQDGLRLVCGESCVRVTTDADSEPMFKAKSADYVRNPGNRFEVLLPKRSYRACWSGPSPEEHECVRFHTSAILEDQV